MIKSITLYGDSILKGVTLRDGRYVVDGAAQTAFSASRGVAVRNICRFGATVEKGLGLISRDLLQNGPPAGLALLEYGGNDSDFLWPDIAAAPEGEHLCRTPPARFRALYRQAAELLGQAGARVACATLPPVDAEAYFRWICREGLSGAQVLRWLGDVNAIYRWQESYSLAVRDMAAELGLPLIDLRGAFLARRRLDGLLCEDGLHPTGAGRELIFETIGGALEGMD